MGHEVRPVEALSAGFKQCNSEIICFKGSSSGIQIPPKKTKHTQILVLTLAPWLQIQIKKEIFFILRKSSVNHSTSTFSNIISITSQVVQVCLSIDQIKADGRHWGAFSFRIKIICTSLRVWIMNLLNLFTSMAKRRLEKVLF